ncbi:hypothetical protein C1G86_1441 [Dehalococcoides mccartyi]|uniref:Uncharacterized protein n=1 Tax=Dehalococcoides mccartyi TaxID=61435 RepID=A0A328ENL3_9CHLR|nr:hypothetical protein C1G87_1405 [Dehalococcoides mccartyi]RAL70116.1 hypothetical protein C1G86_1441 [Dehalococcoides mccartyi]
MEIVLSLQNLSSRYPWDRANQKVMERRTGIQTRSCIPAGYHATYHTRGAF